MSNHSDYTVGWVCAISTEYVAAQVFLDERHEGPEYVSTNDNNDYTLGKVGKHNVVIAVLPDGEYGISSATMVTRDMLHSFPNIRIGLMVGIGGGAPSQKHDIRLGDIVVSTPRDGKGGVIQYDFGKTIQDQSFRTTGFLNQPPAILRTAISGLKAQYKIEGHQLEAAIDNVLEKRPRLQREYKRLDPSNDRLYQSEITHPANDVIGCTTICGNDPSKLVLRPKRSEDEDNPEIHYGLIASANQLMKDATIRDRLAAEMDVLCFEMEAAGLMNQFPCLVIRGICDYSDSHKNKEWQGYAAMAAAAYAKDLLCRIPPNKVEAEKKIRDTFSETLSEILNSTSKIDAHIETVKDKQSSDEDMKILDWLTQIDYDPQQSYFSKRQPGTGQWLLKSPEYQDWVKADKQTFFCPGIPGAGKTFITSLVVNYLQNNYKSSGVAYLYCNIGQQSQQTPETLLGSILKQLVWNRSPLPKEVKSLYDQHKSNRSRPDLMEISKVLQSVISPHSRTFILIDALDECQNHDSCRDILLSEIFNLQAKTRLNIFATSRPQEVEARFSGSIVYEIIAQDTDIEAYLNDKISLWEKSREGDLANIRGIIIKEVIKAADGMFLLATLNMNALQSEETEGEVRDALGKLAKGANKLDQAYEQTMKRVHSQDDSQKRLAIRALAWIFHAKRPLTTAELLHGLAVRPAMSTLDESYIPKVKRLLSVCAGLVRLDEKTTIIDLIHKTTRDYFEITKKTWFKDKQSDITTICVTYLSFDTFQSGYCQTDNDFEQRLQVNKLYDYAACNWGHHAREATTSCQGITEFLQKNAQVEASSQALLAAKRYLFSRRDSQIFPRNMTGLHLAAYFGLEAIIQPLLATAQFEVNSKDEYSHTPLLWAAERGHEGVVKLLLATEQVDVDSKDKYGRTPLSYAARNGHEGVVKLLLATEQVDVDSKDKYDGQTPLSWAAENGHEGIVKLLLATEQVDVDSKDNYYGRTPLSYAAENGHEGVVKLLLATEQVDVDSKDNYYGRTPLSYATRNGYEGVTKLLLATEQVDVDSKDNYYGRTPLSYAAMNGHEGIVKLLLATEQVDVDSKDNYYGRTPLSYAAINGHEGVVKLLLATELG